LLFEPINRKIPTRARMGVKDEGLNILIQKVSQLRPERPRSQEVTVVPTLAPIITPKV
jgi:hypothetical protein